ncbi:spore cortex biosynthesis protein YabQ [Terrilactibacillus sp. S3-3]|nr:spore cortex biosynthesis protein YabQ [Terrilactibacillus sp. S3-3]
MTLNEQFATMLAMVIMGLWIGLSFATYHRFVHGKKRRWIIVITDTIFWALQGLMIFYVLLSVNQGQIRFYIFLAIALGYAMYKALFDKIYLTLLEWLIAVVVYICLFIRKTVLILLIYPIIALLKLVFFLCKITVRFVLSCLLFLLKVILGLLRWTARLVIPKAWRSKGRQWYEATLRLLSKLKSFIMKIIRHK